MIRTRSSRNMVYDFGKEMNKAGFVDPDRLWDQILVERNIAPVAGMALSQNLKFGKLWSTACGGGAGIGRRPGAE